MISTRQKQRNFQARRAGAGFTLIEVMVAMGVIAIGTFTVSLALIQSVRSNKQANSYSKMVALVTDWTERLQGLPRTEAEDAFGTWPGCGIDEYESVVTNPDLTQPGTGDPDQGYATLADRFDEDDPDAPEGSGVLVSFDLAAYCPPARQGKAASPDIANTYRLVGRAFLVEDVNASAGNYRVITSQDISLIFSDRPLE